MQNMYGHTSIEYVKTQFFLKGTRLLHLTGEFLKKKSTIPHAY